VCVRVCVCVCVLGGGCAHGCQTHDRLANCRVCIRLVHRVSAPLCPTQEEPSPPPPRAHARQTHHRLAGCRVNISNHRICRVHPASLLWKPDSAVSLRRGLQQQVQILLLLLLGAAASRRCRASIVRWRGAVTQSVMQCGAISCIHRASILIC
jgi:hypothetical protein